jgi:hypothetical protein
MNSTTQQTNALQLWNQRLAAELNTVLFNKPLHGTVIPIRTAQERSLKAIEIAQRFEVTKHRILVDTIIGRLDHLKDQLERLGMELSHTPWFLFRKAARLKREIASTIDVQGGYRNCLLIIVNTPPPPTI